MTVFYFFSIIKLFDNNFSFSMIIKTVIKNTILYWLFLFFVTSLNTNNTTKVLTTNCYDKQYVANNFWITNWLNYYNSARTSLIKEKFKFWEKEDTYCKIKSLIVNTIVPNENEIKKNYNKITNGRLLKIENKIKEFKNKKKLTLNQKKQLLLTYIYTKILNNTFVYKNKKYVIADPKEIDNNDYSNNDYIAFVNKVDTNNFIKIVLYNKIEKKITVL